MRKGLVLLFAACSLLFCSDTDDGIMYMSGTKGARVEAVEMPNCPYERCDEVSGDKDKGVKRFIQVAKKDLKTAAKLLSSGVYKDHNPDAAHAILGPLQKAINWKDSKPEPFLVQTFYRDYGMTKEQYDKLFLSSVDLLRKNNFCDGYVARAGIVSYGAFGQKKDKAAAKTEWESALKVCPKFGYEWMLATAALSVKD